MSDHRFPFAGGSEAGRRPLSAILLPNGRSIETGRRPLVMGIVNVTPDSFYAPSRRPDPAAAVGLALAMLESGADIIDFGAESTRPGSIPLDGDEEEARLVPVLKAFRNASGAVVSVDTRKARVARAALDEGADIVNDISALADADTAKAVAASGAGIVLMHMKGEPATMQVGPEYGDCALEVRDFLAASADRALRAGISRDRIVLDPGIGFGKRLEHNLDLLKRLYLLADLGYPVLVGLSRKRFVGELTGKPPESRLYGSLGAACAAWAAGAGIFRVHDVEATRDALDLFAACSPVPPADAAGDPSATPQHAPGAAGSPPAAPPHAPAGPVRSAPGGAPPQ